jgi:hypothetical protein
MNAIVAILLLGTGTLAVASLAILTLVITAIHSEERHVRMSEQPSTYAETVARKIMGVHVIRPNAHRICAARRADIAAK